jgi:hypothetical protein
MQFPRSFLVAGEYLPIGWMSSDNGLFYLQMQDDGNLVIYRGSGPSDSHGTAWASNSNGNQDNYYVGLQPDGNFVIYRGTGPSDSHGFVWATGTNQAEGQFFISMQNDGNLVLYKGTGPSDNRGFVWASGSDDPVVDVNPISSTEYDLTNAKILSSAPLNIYSQTVNNPTDTPQTSNINGSESVSETSTWSDSLGIKVGVKTSVETEIPFVLDGKVEVSSEVSNTYTWGGSTQTTKTWGFNVPVTVPPHQTYTVHVLATLSRIVVPYTLKGTICLRSGAKFPGQIQGLYTGQNSHDLQVQFLSLDPNSLQVMTTSGTISAFVK